MSQHLPSRPSPAAEAAARALLEKLAVGQTLEDRIRINTQAYLDALPSNVRRAAWAAAVPHWFDADVLAALLDEPSGKTLYQQLQALPFVETYAEHGHNVHELTRRVMLDDWWRTRREEYLLLSTRAADYFAARPEPEWQIEATYHRLVANPDAGADAVWNLGADWNNTFQYTLIEALVRAGVEHVEAGRVEGRAKGWILYCKGRLEKQSYSNIQALETLEQAIQAAEDDRQLKANVLKAQGDVLAFLDRRDEALTRYEEALGLFRAVGDRLGEANVLKAQGDVLAFQKQNDEALGKYEAALALFKQVGARLGEANALQSRADVLDAQGQTEQASAGYEQAMKLYQAIGDEYSVARALYYLGRLHLRHDDTSQARVAFERSIAIFSARGLPDIAAMVQKELNALS